MIGVAALFPISALVWSHSVERHKGTKGTDRLVAILVNGFLLSFFQLCVALLLFLYLLVPLLSFW
jgi:hypothetical protein